MFTGIIEHLGKVEQLIEEESNLRLQVSSPITHELKVDQSVAHNGVCLTIEKINDDYYEVVAIKETLVKSNLGQLNTGDSINLERCLRLSDRLDGHIVQGHVDETAKVISIDSHDGSWTFKFELNNFNPLIVEKGSICINGVSLTAFEVVDNSFKVGIIPYTFKHTNFQFLTINDTVNIEFDILGKYVLNMQKESAD